MGLYSLMLSDGIAVGLVLDGIADDLGGVQAVFYSVAIIFSGLSLTSGIVETGIISPVGVDTKISTTCTRPPRRFPIGRWVL